MVLGQGIPESGYDMPQSKHKRFLKEGRNPKAISELRNDRETEKEIDRHTERQTETRRQSEKNGREKTHKTKGRLQYEERPFKGYTCYIEKKMQLIVTVEMHQP